MRLPLSILFTFLALLPARLLAVWTPPAANDIHTGIHHPATNFALANVNARQNPTFDIQSPISRPQRKNQPGHASPLAPHPPAYAYTTQNTTTTTSPQNQPQSHIPTHTTPTPPTPAQQPHTNKPAFPQGLAALLSIAPLLPRRRDPRLRQSPTPHSPQTQTYTYEAPLPPTRRTQYSRTPNPTQRHLTYYGFRYYDPETGRWPNRDPIGRTRRSTIFIRLHALNLSDLTIFPWFIPAGNCRTATVVDPGTGYFRLINIIES